MVIRSYAYNLIQILRMPLLALIFCILLNLINPFTPKHELIVSDPTIEEGTLIKGIILGELGECRQGMKAVSCREEIVVYEPCLSEDRLNRLPQRERSREESCHNCICNYLIQNDYAIIMTYTDSNCEGYVHNAIIIKLDTCAQVFGVTLELGQTASGNVCLKFIKQGGSCGDTFEERDISKENECHKILDSHLRVYFTNTILRGGIEMSKKISIYVILVILFILI